eukprot:g1655.t1
MARSSASLSFLELTADPGAMTSVVWPSVFKSIFPPRLRHCCQRRVPRRARRPQDRHLSSMRRRIFAAEFAI